jgi:hypothetical protein
MRRDAGDRKIDFDQAFGVRLDHDDLSRRGFFCPAGTTLCGKIDTVCPSSQITSG